MKKIVLVSFGLIIAGSAFQSKAVSVEQGKAAYDLLLAVPEILLIDVPAIEKNLVMRQSNLSVLKGMVVSQKTTAEKNKTEKKQPPMKSILVTSYLTIGEFKALLDSFVDIIDNIIQKKLILPIGTIIGKKDIGAPFSKVSAVLKNTSNQLTAFVDAQALIVMMVDLDGSALEAQKSKLKEPAV